VAGNKLHIAMMINGLRILIYLLLTFTFLRGFNHCII